MTYPEKSFKVSFDKAAWLIYAFLKQPELGKMALEEAIGGTVTSDVFNPIRIGDYYGTMGWMCRNNGNEKFPKFFLALEDGKYNIGNVPGSPQSETLACPNHTFKYEREVNEANVVEMLKQDTHGLDKTKIENLKDDKIDWKSVVSFIYKIPSDPIGNLYNWYPCSFFENRGKVNNDITDFMGDDRIRAVRYYFGYDDSDKSYFDSNRIRIILIGVDENGKNIIPEDRKVATSSLLESSWPPPPPTNQ